jgi:GTPase SAR1 family protein
VYEIVTEKSFERLEFWKNELQMHWASDMAMIVVGNKIDLNNTRVPISVRRRIVLFMPSLS